MSKSIWILIAIICYIKFSLSFEVNKENCKNNKVLFAPCKFTINIVPPLDSDLQCQLRFTLQNSTLLQYLNNRTFITSSVDNNCPTLEVNIHNGTDNKISSSCGDKTNNISHVFPRFIYGSVFYKNVGVKDSKTNVNIELSLMDITNCYEAAPPPSSSKTIIWILIACAVVLIIIIVIIIVIDCNRKVPPKKPNAQLIVKEDIDRKQNVKTEKENFPQESKPMIEETNA